jgi:hypothetical protein
MAKVRTQTVHSSTSTANLGVNMSNDKRGHWTTSPMVKVQTMKPRIPGMLSPNEVKLKNLKLIWSVSVPGLINQSIWG